MTLRRADSELNHYEHQMLLNQLQHLGEALEGLVCYSEVFANLGTSGEVYRWGTQIRRSFPEHVTHEEHCVLDVIASQGPEWETFAQEMKQQHRGLLRRLEEFCQAMDELEDSTDLERCITDLKSRGQDFAQRLATHMGAEERKLASMSNA